uniref:Ribosomal protein S14 n=1 Tax=Ancoracysta twista TaxID=2044563 RepID=A0A2H4R8D6_9EUKA|nr:ribosomal protein S14 [Ancoracysta twista]ATY40907.1 ribosomal protein S14 [Ancoracysta twista]
MKHSIRRDQKKRKLFRKQELKRKALQTIIYNEALSQKERWMASIHLNKLPRSGSLTRIKNRCVLTGRGKGVEARFRLSRITLKELALENRLPGLRKASW